MTSTRKFIVSAVRIIARIAQVVKRGQVCPPRRAFVTKVGNAALAHLLILLLDAVEDSFAAVERAIVEESEELGEFFDFLLSILIL